MMGAESGLSNGQGALVGVTCFTQLSEIVKYKAEIAQGIG
jgi:hypothetical protein